MSDPETVLVPIRYPLTAHSTQTLVTAEHIADDGAHLLVLHVDLFQYGTGVKAAEIRRAIAPLLEGVTFSVSVRRGFLIEELILQEAIQADADVIVIGERRNPWWKRLFDTLFRTEPDVAPYLEENAGSDIAVETVQ